VRRFCRALYGLEPSDPLLTMYFAPQPGAAGGHGSSLLLPRPRALDLPPLATGCNHGAP